MKVRITLSVDVEVYRNFKALCAKKGVTVSEEVEKFMRERLREEGGA